MAIRIPREYEKQGGMLFEISQGERPATELKPAKYLPVLEEDKYLNDWKVIMAGTIVSVDASGYLVPANGGVARDVVYTTNDIGKTIDVEDTGWDAYVTTAKTAVGGLAANKPVGVAPYDYYQSTIADLHTNYMMQDKTAILCDYFVEVPYTRGSGVARNMDASGTLAHGDLLQPGSEGHFVKWVDGLNPVDQICGRVLTIKSDFPVGGLEKVQTVPGLGLAGSDTGGIPQHLSVSDNYPVKAVQIQLINM